MPKSAKQASQTEIEKLKKLRHFFVRDAQEFPVACIATEKVDNKILYAMSICNPLDFHCFNQERAIVIAGKRLMKYINGGYDHAKPPEPGTPDFGGSKVGMLPYTEGENVKMSLLTFLETDPHLPTRFREAVSARLDILRKKAAERVQEKLAGGDAAAS